MSERLPIETSRDRVWAQPEIVERAVVLDINVEKALTAYAARVNRSPARVVQDMIVQGLVEAEPELYGHLSSSNQD